MLTQIISFASNSSFHDTSSSRKGGKNSDQRRRIAYSFLLVTQNLNIPEGANDRDNIWDRVIDPSKWMKYINKKCNLNNEIKRIYMSMRYLL